MTQQEVFKCLEKSNEPLTVNEIGRRLGEEKTNNIQRALRVMIRYNEIKRIRNKEDKRKYSYIIINL